MAGTVSDYAENKLLDHLTGKTSFTMPTVSIGLWTATLSDTSTGATAGEVSGGSYARKTTAGSDWNAASSGSVTNANALAFPTATGSWGTITHFALLDSATAGAGNILLWADLTTSKTVSSGDTAQFNASALTLTMG